MADTVRYIAEEMIPELEDFEKRKYFTKVEIKQMVKKRLQFEYLLKRKVPLKADFLRYIQYEERLEALRVHRREERGMAGKHTMSEWAIPRRIHFIYDRALRRFKGDLDLWTRWLQHCRAAGSPRQMSKVLTRALQLHPTEPRLWSHAAGFEFEDHHNPAAARLLLQRGLRICPNSIPLWLETFRLELLYAHQLRSRRHVLGLDPGTKAEVLQSDPLGDAPELEAAATAHHALEVQDQPAAASQPSIPQKAGEPAELDALSHVHPTSPTATQDDGSSLSHLPPEPSGNGHPAVLMFGAVGSEPTNDDTTGQPGSSDDAAFKRLLEGSIAHIVFKNAAEAHPHRLELRSRLLETLRPFTFPGVASLSQDILADVALRFLDDPQAWDLRARAAWNPFGQPSGAHATKCHAKEHLQAATAVYEEAVQQLSCLEMYRLYAAFLQEVLSEHAASDEAGRPHKQSTAELLCNVFERAADKGMASEEMLLGWAALHMAHDRSEAAAAATMRSCQLLPASCALWQRRLALLAQSAAPQVAQAGSKKERRAVQQVLQAAADEGVKHVPAPASAPLWLQLFPAFQALALPCSTLAQLLLHQLMGLAKGAPESAMGQAAAAAVKAVWAQDGPEAARQLWQRMLTLPPPGLAVFNAVLDLEIACEAAEASKQGPYRIQQTFEAAVDAYGQTDVNLWIRYIQHQQQMVQGRLQGLQGTKGSMQLSSSCLSSVDALGSTPRATQKSRPYHKRERGLRARSKNFSSLQQHAQAHVPRAHPDVEAAPSSAADADELVLSLSVVKSINEVDPAEWDACALGSGEVNPFTLHSFLKSLEDSKSAVRQTGWLPQHVLLKTGGSSPQLLACCPMYLKSHSYGEYVFDHSWAGYFSRSGTAYYPKLQSCVPFTPASGNRLLVRPDAYAPALSKALGKGLTDIADQMGVSSLHMTFNTEQEWQTLARVGFLKRNGIQYHWQNNGYSTFDDFLMDMKQSKRKNVRQERKHVHNSGLKIERLTGDALKPHHWDAFYGFYINTSDKKWGSAYLTRDFFDQLQASMPDRVLLVMAFEGDKPVAGALNLIGSQALFGRNWGCAWGLNVKFLHFELCYYQAIEAAIERGLSRVEAGAQGEHKIQRGYVPSLTYSSHYFPDASMRSVVNNFLQRESMQIDYTLEALSLEAPFKPSPAGTTIDMPV
ncbi:hypothetical protein WJX74_008746 [Apatococcus lobatus]|uniref:Uncharacterized protein n=1 Tax=Apatococcus lobatus TaxID=904363 RepID=A0AAW1R3Y2_9CHLO